MPEKISSAKKSHHTFNDSIVSRDGVFYAKLRNPPARIEIPRPLAKRISIGLMARNRVSTNLSAKPSTEEQCKVSDTKQGNDSKKQSVEEQYKEHHCHSTVAGLLGVSCDPDDWESFQRRIEALKIEYTETKGIDELKEYIRRTLGDSDIGILQFAKIMDGEIFGIPMTMTSLEHSALVLGFDGDNCICVEKVGIGIKNQFRIVELCDLYEKVQTYSDGKHTWRCVPIKDVLSDEELNKLKQ